MSWQRMAGRGGPGWLALCCVALLAGCGSGDGDGTFHEYGDLEQQSSAEAAVAGGETTESQPAADSDAQPLESTEPIELVRITSPPVAAPIPTITSDEADSLIAPSEPGTAVVAKVPAAPVAGGAAVDAAPVAAEEAAPREIKVLVPERTFDVTGPENAIRVTFDDIDLLKVINMDPVTAEAPEFMPAWQRELDGKRIRIRGYMYPAFKDTGITSFLIARDTQKCCFGSEAKVYDRFLVRMREGVTTDYMLTRPFDVVGVFHIEPIMLDGELFQLYKIDDAIVIEK